ncbi:hypothetical protein EMIHUDRAFT_231934 [Emiliania huxleyi CCMP1516]|uniref:RanBP2-type domain-containing protein n=2 Tax=Emiliania huxleyi TaxID=2903 RepID=A0A0D3K6G9_EMIH1|nr:hypothetical protein EMIHUDRAFT_231934 [Emiliania huxleyi CCMP1516]EOD31354.1 hypothetical protein EMIHUDRAFT_231934 [Emiliania huxleyi CCMP1516]|eukprot:XP_005783783.1 hypothetical protein EMIHUDRAFT_231934 [Emiliania huxleyi CCMP1516]
MPKDTSQRARRDRSGGTSRRRESSRSNVFASKTSCFRCNTPKPGTGGGYGYGGMGGGMGGGYGMGGGDTRPGDWTCTSCGVNVFASKNACFRCNAPKPAGMGGGMGGYGGGGYGYGAPPPPYGGGGYGAPPPYGGGGGGGGGGDTRPGDWTCPSCNSNVFASKSACFRCGAPKPAGGGGGGY